MSEEINPIVSKAIKLACKDHGQSDNVASRILAWFRAAGEEGLSAQEKAQRIGEIRDEIVTE